MTTSAFTKGELILIADTGIVRPGDAKDLAKFALELLDENLKLKRVKDALEAAALAMRDDMREAREPYICPRCGRTSTRPNGEHYCHKRNNHD